MPLYMEIHRGTGTTTVDSLREARRKDFEVQGKYGVTYRDCWFSEDPPKAICLFDAPDREAGIKVHRESHGMLADEVIEVKRGEIT
jgi:hypothetical protein